jgi:SAM-dependent methyltransferase
LSRAGSITACRSCGSVELVKVLDLGSTPLANELTASPDEKQEKYPLGLVVCKHCSLAQTSFQVSGKVIFGRDYPYYSSVSTAYLDHARQHALELIDSRQLGPKSLVVEVASNDGYMLQNFVEKGIPVLGVDPAEGPAMKAREVGVDTLVDYFGTGVALEICSRRGTADVILGNNVMAHVDDINDLVEGVSVLLDTSGVAVFEAPYVVDLVERCAFDTIYHEHNCYFSLTSLKHLFERHDLILFDVRHLPIHGGSLRIVAGRGRESSQAVRDMLAAEKESGIDSPIYYEDFGNRVGIVLESLRIMLTEFRRSGKRVAAYAAAAKGAVICNLAGFGSDDIIYVVDKNPHKQGRYMPGNSIPIVSIEHLAADPPDYLLLFAWNIADEIRAQLTEFKGQYIIPIPEPRIL